MGDLISSETDEQAFGCTYDELTWFGEHGVDLLEGNRFLREKFKNVIALHKKNSFKYDHKTEVTDFNPNFI